MLEANIKTLLANVRPEEVGLESVTLFTGYVTHLQAAQLSESYNSFEFLRIYCRYNAVADGGSLTVAADVDVSYLQTTTDSFYQLYDRSSPSTATATGYIYMASTTDTQIGFAGSTDGAVLENTAIYKIVGYKRRYSKTSLAEITEAASKPNLFNNTWHAGAKVRNQRGFDGDWSSLAIGAYGLDGWLKTDSTHKGFIVAAGSYKPSTKHIVIAEDGGILGEVMSPADGGHWSHSFPFAADKFVLREGNLPLGWSPDTDSRLNELNRDFLRFYAGAREYLVTTDTFGHYRPVFTNRDFTRPPVITKISGGTTGGGGASLDLYIVQSQTSSWCIQSKLTNLSGVASTVNVDNVLFELDATIALSEVTDDAEHRVVWE